MFSKSDETAPGHYDPPRTALLLMDFHGFILDRAGEAKAAATTKVAADMRDWAKGQGMHVVHCLIDPGSEPFGTCKDVDMFRQIAGHLRSNGEEPAELNRGGGDTTFVRRLGYVSAFRSPGLQGFLEKEDVRSLLLFGLSTSGCVLRTAVAASDLEFVVTTISDGCADFDDELHDVLAHKVLGGRGYVATSAEFQAGYSTRS